MRKKKKGGGAAVAAPPDDGRGVPKAPPGTMRGEPAGGKLIQLPMINGIQPVADPDIRSAIPELSERVREGLYDSLREHGLFQPITLVDYKGTPLVLDGLERLELWATIQSEFPDWQPKLPLRADVLPSEDIVGDQTDSAVCICLLIARAIAINSARRQMEEGTVRRMIESHLIREYKADLQRSSKWLASDLGCSLPWLLKIRRDLWAARTIHCPPTLWNRRERYDANPDYKKAEKTSRPDTHVKARSLPQSELFEEVGPEPAPFEFSQDEEEVGSASDTEFETGVETLPEVEADAQRFEAEDKISEWNKTRAKPFDPDYLEWLHEGGFVVVTPEGEVRYLADESQAQIEATLNAKLGPLFEDLGVPQTALQATIHRLLSPTKPRKR